MKIGEIKKILGTNFSQGKEFDKQVKYWRNNNLIRHSKTGTNNRYFAYKLSEIQRQLVLSSDRQNYLWFKDERSREIAKKLWLPVFNFSNPAKLDTSDKALKNTWFNVSKISFNPTIKDLLSRYSGPPLKPTDCNRTRKYRLYLTKDMIRTYISWFDITRFIYNKCVEFYYSEKNKGTPFREITEGLIYSKVVSQKKSNYNPEVKEWIKKCPAAIKTTTVRDFYQAMTKLEKRREKSIKYAELHPDRKVKIFDFTMKFRLKREYQSFVIKNEDIRGEKDELSCFPTFTEILGPILRSRRGITDINNDIRIVWNGVRGDGCGIYAHVSYNFTQGNRENKVGTSCSIDPGERTFISVYGSDGNAYTIGDRASRKIDNLGKIAQRMRQGIKRVVSKDKKGRPLRNSEGHLVKTLEKVTKENTKNPGRTLKRLNEKSKILEARAKRLLFELHHKAVKFLTDNYDTIIIPKFNTKKICEKLDIQGEYKRKIGKDVARRLQRLSHYKFRELLIAKGGARVYVGTEQYTSKTCGNCFNLHENLGGKHTFKCPNCPLVGHRDLLAARNIMILNADKARLDL